MTAAFASHPFDLAIATGVLPALLCSPPGSPPPWATALLLPGSGPIDHDGNAPGAPLGIQLALAEALAVAGMASVRFDRRGVADDHDWKDATFSDNYADARQAWLAMAADPRVDTQKMVLIGHSEGALHATQLAADGALRPAPCATVLLAGSAQLGRDVLLRQARLIGRSSQPGEGQSQAAHAAAILEQAEEAQRQIRATSTNVADVSGVPINAGWLRQFLDYNPKPDLLKVRGPMLAITGDKDLQVDPDDLTTMAEAVPGPCRTLRPADLTHLLRHDPAPPTLADYPRQIAEPVDTEVIDTVCQWLTGLVVKAP